VVRLELFSLTPIDLHMPPSSSHSRSLHWHSTIEPDSSAETDRALLELEQQALQVARRIITPHQEITALFPDRAILLDWQLLGNFC
jgi:hypothetical protein